MRVSRIGLVAFVVALLSPAIVAQSPPVANYDLVIRNGHVLDGAGNPSIRADVAIKDGRFARIGIVTGRGRQEIDAAGKYVSPGWIDMMDQSGGTLLKNGLAENKLFEGVTTAIGGEGGTPVPPSGFPSTSRRWSDKASASTSVRSSRCRNRLRDGCDPGGAAEVLEPT